MSFLGRTDDGFVAEDLAEYGLVLLMDDESGDDLSAVRRGIAADAGNRQAEGDEEESSFVFVIPWHRRKDRFPLTRTAD